MKNLIRLKRSRATRLAASAVAVAAAVAGAVGIVAERGNAAPLKAGKTSHPHKKAKFEHPKLKRGVLTIKGTNKGDKVALRLKAGNTRILQVDVGDNGSADFSFKRKQIAKISVDARAGNDLVRIDERNGVFTDTIATALAGGDGNDTLLGGSGAETLLGGPGNDSIDGNKGNDLALMGAGDDTFVWDPGDGSDVVEGQDGTDTMRFNGANAAERIDLSANGKRFRLVRDVGPVTMDTAGVERVELNALGGADLVTVNDLAGTDVGKVTVGLAGTAVGGDGQSDRVVVNGTSGNDTINVAGGPGAVSVSGLAATIGILHPEATTDQLVVNGLGGNDVSSATALAAQAIVLTLDGGAGDDRLAGGQGAETLLGGDGDDTLDGNKGNDLGLMGAGDDAFVWDPGDGSDVVEGQSGADTMRFNGADVAERVALSANGKRLSFLRDPGRVTMDTAGVERVDFNALGGADVVNVDDLTGTEVGNVNVDLASALGGATGDGQLDHVVVNGTNGGDTIKVKGDASAIEASGLRPLVAIRHQDPTDELVVNGLDGNDDLAAAALAAQAIALTLDGGAGDDSIFGGQGSETLLGGDGNDTLDGFKGNDVALMGPGDDLFEWDPGDGSDTVEGQDGIDTLSFIGANIAEQIDVSATGNRVRFHRDIGNVTMDTAGVELINFEALAGADVVTVNDLTGTDLISLQVDLDGTANGGDGEADRVVVNGTDGEDGINVNGDASGVNVKGLAPTVGILHPEIAHDRLEINTLAGRDSVDSSRLAAGAIQLFVDGLPVP